MSVVPISGWTADSRIPNEGVIALARELLEKAESGELQGLAVASVIVPEVGNQQIVTDFAHGGVMGLLIATSAMLTHDLIQDGYGAE